MVKVYKLLIIALSLLPLYVFADITVAPVFTDNMVIQQEKPVYVWGKAPAGEKIKISFMSQRSSTVADANGEWIAVLKAVSATKKPQKLVVSSRSEKIVLSNILVGEVWLASGQSNMEYSMNNHPHHARPKKGDPEVLYKEFKAADSPIIRTMYVECSNNGEILPTAGWKMLSEESLAPVSAAGYFFAKNLSDSLDVPVGLISSSWGGSMIESWMPEEAFKGSPQLNDGYANGSYYGLPVADHYRTMIAPLAPFSMRGFLWYQGEANVLDQRGVGYDVKQRALIDGWRKAWHDDAMPFYFVQLAPYLYSDRKGDENGLPWDALPKFWEEQASCLDVPHTGMIVINDLVDNLKDIHPPYKWIVGKRLALLALNKTYGRDVVSSGPTFKSMEVEGDKVILTFENADGLKTRDGKMPDNFKLKNTKNRYNTAKAQIVDNKVVLSSKTDMARPVTVRYCWSDSSQPNLCNGAGLPAAPFRATEKIK